MSKLNRLAPVAITLGQISFGMTLGLFLGTLLTIPSKERRMEANFTRCADIHQSARIAELNYLLGKDKEHTLLYRPIFDENLEVYEEVVDQIYSQDYQPHPIIREAQTSIITSDAYLTCLQEFLPPLEDEDVVQN